MGIFPEHLPNIFFNEECCNSASLTPASSWLASSKNFYTPWVRLPTERTKVVTMGALLKFNGLATFFFLILSSSSSGFSAFRIWKSLIASGSTAHRAAAFSKAPKFVAGETDLVLRRFGLSVEREGVSFRIETDFFF